jgi:endonuclease YncB( thermonuclease family)
MNKHFLLGLLIAAAMNSSLSAAADVTKLRSYPVVVGQAGVTDGDTIRMGKATITAEGRTIEKTGVRIRFFGIDAPEKRQVCLDAKGKQYFCGQNATQAVAEIAHNKEMTCYVLDIDRYERLVAVCSVPGIPDMNAELVKRGLAVAYREYSVDYVDEEEIARAARVGLWAGKFEMPWEWRKAH